MAASLEHFDEMLHVSWLLDDKAKGGAAHRRLGRVSQALGDRERASQHLAASLRLFKKVEDQRGVAAVLDDLGRLLLGEGAYRRALEHHNEALAIKKQVGDPRAIAVSIHNIGRVHQEAGDFAAASEQIAHSEDLADRALAEPPLDAVSIGDEFGAAGGRQPPRRRAQRLRQGQVGGRLRAHKP